MKDRDEGFARLVIASYINVWLSLYEDMAHQMIHHGNIDLPAIRTLRRAWNKGRIVGQTLPLKPQSVWANRVPLAFAENRRGLALRNISIDRKLRGCDVA